MAQTIKLKRSSTEGNIPTTSQLELGEVAINTYDGKMFIKKDVGGTESIVEISAAAADAILVEYQFTSTASQTTYSGSDDNTETLSYTPNAIQIFMNGILLDPGVDFTATNGTSIVLAEAADANDYLQIFAFKKKISDGSVTVDTFTGDDSTTAFTLSVDPGDENNTRVFIDGVYQSKDNYSVSGTTLTFSTAPPTGTAIEIEIGNRVVTLDTLSDLDLPDDVKLRLGTGQDLQIYSDGTNSYIEERNTTSGLRITSDNQVAIRKHDNENIALFNVDGAVRLYHDNSQKFETTSAGIDVTGSVTSDSLVISGTNANLSFGASGNNIDFGRDADNYISAQTGSTSNIVIDPQNRFVVRTADTERMRIDSSGRVGIGTTSPQAKLHIDGDGTYATIRGYNQILDLGNWTNGEVRIESTGAPFHLRAAGNQPIHLETDNVERVTVLGTGNVGIGTTSPATGLHLVDKTLRLQKTASDRKLEFVDDRTGSNHFSIEHDANQFYFWNVTTSESPILFKNNGDVTMTAGNVGIGTSSPVSKLHVQDGDLKILTPSGTGGRYFSLDNTDTGGRDYRLISTNDSHGSLGGGDFAILDYDVSGNDAAKTRLLIDSSGNVGIGTTSPSYKLDVSGEAHFKDGSSAALFQEYSNGMALWLDGSNGDFQGADYFGIHAYGTTSLDFSYGALSKFSIGSNGNVGIGTSSPGRQLEIFEAGRAGAYRFKIKGDTGHTGMEIENTSSSNTNILFRNPSYTQELYMDYNGKFHVYNNSSHRFTIDQSGNVGIGTTSPDTKLDVDGLTNGGIGFTASQVEIDGSTTLANGRIFYHSSHLIYDSPSSGHRFAVAGNQGTNIAMVIDSGQNVGIGTTSPLAKLHVNAGEIRIASSAAYNTHLNYQDTGVNIISQANSGTTEIRNSSSTLFYLNASGKVGIGTTSPGQLLDVAGATAPTIRITNTDNTLEGGQVIGALEFKGSDDSEDGTDVLAAIKAISTDISPDSELAFFTLRNIGSQDDSITERMRIDNNGNVGIGTDSPFNSTDYKTLNIRGTNGGQILLGNSSSSYTAYLYTQASGTVLGATAGTSLQLHAGGGEQVRITSAGRVGIGTTAPSSLVHASQGNQALGFDAGFWASANPSDYTVGRGAGITMQNADVYTGGIYGIREVNSWNGALTFYTHTGSSGNTFGTTFTEKMRITSDGNVGIGVTPQGDWNSGYRALQIAESATIMGAASDDGIWISNNAIFSSSGSWEYVTAHKASSLDMQDSVAPFRFRYAASGTAGAAISWSEAMRINNSGYVLIGKTNTTFSTAGIELRGGNLGARFTRNFAEPILVNRTGNNGDIIKFYGDTVELGAIGSEGGDSLYIQSNGATGSGIRFHPSRAAIEPVRQGATIDNVVDLGADSRRFKDLYLSGALKLLHSASGAIHLQRWEPTVNTNNSLGQIVFGGSEDGGTTVNNSASIVALSSQNHTSTTSGGYLTFSTTPNNTTTLTERLRINHNGNVGIGTTTPQYKLDVVVDNNSWASFGRTISTSNYAGIHFGYLETGNTNYRKSAIVFERTDLTEGNAQGKVHILNGPQSGSGSATLSDAKFTIREDGNVGIGDTNPESQLEVNEASNYRGVHVRGSNAPSFTLAKGTTSTPEWRMGISGYDGNDFAISTGSTTGDQMRMDPDGNVMFGLDEANFAPRTGMHNNVSTLQTLGPIISGYSQGSYTSAARNIRDWFVYAGPSTNTNVYVHMKTNLDAGSSSNTQYTMSSFTYHNYYAYGGSYGRGQIGWHNWSGTLYNVTRHNEGTLELVQPSYVSTDGYVVLVAKIDAGYAQFSIDWFQWAGYTFREAKVTAVTQHSAATGAY